MTRTHDESRDARPARLVVHPRRDSWPQPNHSTTLRLTYGAAAR